MSSAERVRLAADEYIWRRIHRTHLLGDGIVSSAAFNDDELSVDRRSIVQDLNHGIEYTRQNGAGVVELQVVDIDHIAMDMDADLQAVADEQDDNPAHALVLGKKTKKVQRALRDKSTFIP